MAMGAVSLCIPCARVIDPIGGVTVGGISIESSRAGVTIRAVKGADSTVARETGYKGICPGKVCAMTIGAVI